MTLFAKINYGYMYESLVKKENKIGIIGLGYVGLPIALAFAKKVKVVGFDINDHRVQLMKQNIDPSGELEKSEFEKSDIHFSSNPEDLKSVNFFIVAVPTPVDAHNVPDLVPVKKASETIGKAIKKGDYVVFESTVYPGCTEEDCIPIIEQVSGLTFKKDFKVGFSPERINPGDKQHTLQNVIKVVSGCDEISLEEISKVYELVVEAGVHKASSIMVAEAAKIIENTQRDLNIALMNELSIIFDRMGINTYDVLEAAGTKWNFLKFQPGLVGGHCIGVDPYYLTYKAAELGFNSRVILAGRYINDNMGNYLAKKILQHIIGHCENVKKAKILVLGVTFKENVSDIRNSKVVDVIKTLQSYHLNVFVSDPYASSTELEEEYGIKLVEKLENDYDAIIVSVPHEPYLAYTDQYFSSITNKDALLADLKGVYKGRITGCKYWSF